MNTINKSFLLCLNGNSSAWWQLPWRGSHFPTETGITRVSGRPGPPSTSPVLYSPATCMISYKCKCYSNIDEQIITYSPLWPAFDLSKSSRFNSLQNGIGKLKHQCVDGTWDSDMISMVDLNRTWIGCWSYRDHQVTKLTKYSRSYFLIKSKGC